MKSKNKKYRWGLLDFSKPFPKAYRYACILGIVSLVACIVLSAMEVIGNKSFSDSSDVIIGFLGLYGIVAPIFVGLNCIIWKIGNAWYKNKTTQEEKKKTAEKAAREAFEKDHPHYEQEQFYLQCKEQGITEVDTPASVARMMLFARNHNIPGTEGQLIAAFKCGENDVRRLEKRKQIESTRYKEMELEAANLQVKDDGPERKRAHMCQIQVLHYREEENHYRAKSRATHEAIFNGTAGAMRKETDWAIHGGIASGIAGPAAGVAVASDIQRKNAEIREQNAQLSTLAAQVAINASRETDHLAYEASCKADEWDARVKEANNKLTQLLDPQKLLNMLSPKGSANNSETGAITVSVKINKTAGLVIYESVSAVVDGVLAVDIMADGEIVGKTYLPLPWNGAAYATTLKGVCTEPVRQAKRYEVVVSAHCLWAAEI